MMVHACNPSYSAVRDKKMVSSRSSQAKLARPYIKKKIKTKDREPSSNGRVLIYQVPGPRFNLQ
jgi:hypothetical protein